MIGSIDKINDNIVEVLFNIDISKVDNLVNSFVLIKDKQKSYIGEVSGVTKDRAQITLIGQYIGSTIKYGVSSKPSFGAGVYLISKEFIPTIVGTTKGHLIMGNSPIYDTQVGMSLDSFFGQHFAIFGSTGSGKSCSFARIIQSIYEQFAPKNARFIIFDAYGEYHQAFQGLTGFKAITTNTKSQDEMLKIPLWLLDTDDIALLLNATTSNQLIFIDKALRFVNIFAQEEENVILYKNSIIAKALLELLMSGRNPVQIRDQIISLLSKYCTADLNLDSKIEQPGYVRTLRQCLLIDQSGKLNAIELIEAYLETFVVENMKLNLPDGSFKYTLNDLLDSLDFALIDEGIWKSEDVYDSTNFLKVRLENLIKSDAKYYFDMDYVTKDQFLVNLFLLPQTNQLAQIINFNINYVDDRFAKVITKIYTKLLFEYAKNLEVRASIPFNIILEEAHRYVQNDNDVKIIGYNIFERVCKEGRKYGVLMGFISQRPSELSETCLSQCSNFILFKLIHSRDIEYVRASIPYITEEIIAKLKGLMPGNAIMFGRAFNFPILNQFDMPNPAPSSDNVSITKLWL